VKIAFCTSGCTGWPASSLRCSDIHLTALRNSSPLGSSSFIFPPPSLAEIHPAYSVSLKPFWLLLKSTCLKWCLSIQNLLPVTGMESKWDDYTVPVAIPGSQRYNSYRRVTSNTLPEGGETHVGKMQPQHAALGAYVFPDPERL